MIQNISNPRRASNDFNLSGCCFSNFSSILLLFTELLQVYDCDYPRRHAKVELFISCFIVIIVRNPYRISYSLGSGIVFYTCYISPAIRKIYVISVVVKPINLTTVVFEQIINLIRLIINGNLCRNREMINCRTTRHYTQKYNQYQDFDKGFHICK